MKKPILKNLIEQEKLLYLEVEQLRSSLSLHDSSLIFEFFSAFYFAGQDIKKIFVRSKNEEVPMLLLKQKSILSLLRKKKWLHILRKTPYAYVLYFFKYIRTLVSFRSFRQAQGKLDKKSYAQIKSRKINSYIIFGTTDSSDFQSRSVQISQKLSEKVPVTYIEGVFDEGSRPGFRIIESFPNFTAIRLTAKKILHLNYQNPSRKEVAFLKKSLQLATKDHRPSITYLHHPFWSLIFPLKKYTYTYDNAYGFIQTGAAGKHIVKAEKKCIKHAELLTAPHIALFRDKRDILVKNGVDWDAFKDTSKMIQTCDVGLCWIKKPVMGYIGTLDEKIDEDLLFKLAASFPTASIVLVGNTDYRPVIEVAEKSPNIFPVGKQPYKKLPLFLQSFDILISPFKYDKSTVFNHPELPLYLASGKPIVAPSATAAVAKGLLYTPKSHTDWALAIANALKEKKRSKKRLLRMETAKKSGWVLPRRLIYKKSE